MEVFVQAETVLKVIPTHHTSLRPPFTWCLLVTSTMRWCNHPGAVVCLSVCLTQKFSIFVEPCGIIDILLCEELTAFLDLEWPNGRHFKLC